MKVVGTDDGCADGRRRIEHGGSGRAAGILAESAVVLVFVVFLCLMGLGLFRVLVP